jgi:hypothetical protein
MFLEQKRPNCRVPNLYCVYVASYYVEKFEWCRLTCTKRKGGCFQPPFAIP